MLSEKRKRELFTLDATSTNDYDPFEDMELTAEECNFLNDLDKQYATGMAAIAKEILANEAKDEEHQKNLPIQAKINRSKAEKLFYQAGDIPSAEDLQHRIDEVYRSSWNCSSDEEALTLAVDLDGLEAELHEMLQARREQQRGMGEL